VTGPTHPLRHPSCTLHGRLTRVDTAPAVPIDSAPAQQIARPRPAQEAASKMTNSTLIRRTLRPNGPAVSREICAHLS
jgi:hypothetical protein